MSEKQPTKQEVAKERTLSDAELIKKGAEYKEGEKTERLEVSQEVIDQAKKEMEETIAGKTKEAENQSKKGEEKPRYAGKFIATESGLIIDTPAGRKYAEDLYKRAKAMNWDEIKKLAPLSKGEDDMEFTLKSIKETADSLGSSGIREYEELAISYRAAELFLRRDQAKKEMRETITGKTNEVEDQTKKGEEKVKSAGGTAEDVKDAQKAGEELKDKTKSSAEQAKEAKETVKEKKPKTPEELSKDLQVKRTAYIDAERKLEEARKKNGEGLAALSYAFQEARLDYENSRASYAKDLYEKEIALLKQSGLSEDDPRYKQELCNFTGDLYRNVLANEYDRLAQAKSENLTPLKRTWFRNTLEKFNKMPRWQRVLITTGLVTAVAGSGAGLGAAMIFAGSRFARGMAGGILAAKGAAVVKTIGGRRVEEWLSQQDNNLRTQFEVDLSGEATANNFEMFRDNMNRLFTERNQVVQETNRRHRNITLLASGTAVLIGGATALSLSGGGVSSALEQKGSAISGKDILGGGGKTSFGFPATSDQVLGVKMGPSLDIKEAMASAKLGEITVAKGDNLWNIIDKKLDNIYGSKFDGLGEARKTYILDSIKDEISRNPGAYGIKNIDELQVGQKINLSGVIAEHKMNHIFDAAKHLTENQLKDIHEHITGHAAPGTPEAVISEELTERAGADYWTNLAPGEKMEAVMSKLYPSEQDSLKKIIQSYGGTEKFLKMPASMLFYQEGAELDIFREKFGLQLKQLTRDSYMLHDNVSSIEKVLESIDPEKMADVRLSEVESQTHIPEELIERGR